MGYRRPNRAAYRFAQGVSWLAARALFRLEMGRNEIKDKEGPFLVIANHQCMLDFVNLMGAARRPMTFVLSKSFFSTLPIPGFLEKLGVIPKQQFQTTVGDMKRMKAVVEAGEPLVIYPAGLMCEDGLSTPVPKATYKFLKWMKTDVYMARTEGSYFVMPKWSKKLRPGKTTMDITLLFAKEELETLSLEQIQARTDAVLLYDAYREQEAALRHYAGNQDIRGLENVLYLCPACGREYTMEVTNRSVLGCTACGFRQQMDENGFFHCQDPEREIRYASDWSKLIQQKMQQQLEADDTLSLSAEVIFQTVDHRRHKMADAGEGTILLKRGSITLSGTIHGSHQEIRVPIQGVPALPFSPGRYLEVQHGEEIYRCVFRDGKPVMKFIHLLKSLYRLEQAQLEGAKETVS